MFTSRLLTLATLCVWLTGCSSLVKQKLVATPEAICFASMEAWEMEGRIGVKAKANAWHAQIIWNHEKRQDRLQIVGPLNQGMVSIVMRADLIYINDGNNKEVLSRKPEQSLHDHLGFSVPIHSLKYWVMGLHDPAYEYEAISHNEGDVMFQQLGWKVLSSQYHDKKGYQCPGRLEIQGKDVKLKLIIDQWQITATKREDP